MKNQYGKKIKNTIPVNLTQKFERVVTKSKAGVEYTKYKPYLVGANRLGKNRTTRRLEKFARPIKPTKFNNPVYNAQKKAIAERVARKQGIAHKKAVERKKKSTAK